MTGSTPVPASKEKIEEERKKEEIKQIKKEKIEMQPLTIPEKVETAKWKIDDVIKVIKLDLDDIDYEGTEEGTAIHWDEFADKAIPKIMEQFREEFSKSGIKFPIVLQSSMKVMCSNLGSTNPPFYKGYRTDSVANINHVANNFEQLESILRKHLVEIIEKTITTEGDSDIGVYDVLSYHIRFW
jgi:hypothetical protein